MNSKISIARAIFSPFVSGFFFLLSYLINNFLSKDNFAKLFLFCYIKDAMKKLYKEKKFISFNIKRSKHVMKKRSVIKRKTKQTVVSGRARNRKLNNIKAPKVLSVVKNPDATIDFLSKISTLIKKSKPVSVKLDEVIELTPDAILYLLVLIEEAKYKNVLFKGSAPRNKKAHSIFVSSGFYDFVKSDLKRFQIPINSDILKIKNGKDVNGKEAENIQNYLKEHVHNISNEKLKAIYSILIECMSNTNEYAGETMGAKYWWTMALHDRESDKVLFAFVDNGVGIPTTVRKKLFDKSTDSELLKRAAKGIYQMSGSKKITRNKGLPQIRKYNEDGFIEHLVIVSNNGYYSVENDIKNLDKYFKGTMIAWEFV